MTKRMLIDASHAEETRVVVLDGNRLEEFDLESANRKPLKGNIYLAKVVRVEPSLQAAFVEYGGNRHGFLAFGEIHPDYYQLPVADRQRLLEMQAAEAREEEEEEERQAAAAARAASSGHGRRGRSGRDGGRASIEAAAASAEEAAGAEGAPEILAADDASGDGAAGTDMPAGTVASFEAAEGAAAPPPAEDSLPAAAEERPAEAAAPATVAEDPVHDQDSLPTAAAMDAEAGAEPTGSAAEAEAVSSEAEGEPVPSRFHAAPNGHAEDGFPGALDAAGLADADDEDDEEEEAPPETLGGADEPAEDMARERRIPPRFLRHYKIQEVIKRRQIMLVQVVKEERGTKGAALTTYISLAGRFSVLMPNSPRGGGVSRKITSATDRKRLREAIDEVGLPQGMSLIVRTAGAQRPKPEIKRDCEYLLRLWDNIRERTLASTAPALIYEEADLIKRSIRDVFSRDVEEILVEGEDAFQDAREFMRMLMPQHVRKIQLAREGGLFARGQVEAQLEAIHSPVVQLRSGGYIVINQTEALVAIDVNSGRATRDRHIEDTALRTNCEAADEIARQLRLRDLAGLIVIDFIDMESGKHDAMVERRLKEALRFDRARIQVGRISHFGLLEMSRQRLRPSLGETAFVTCPHCQGRGNVRSVESSALMVLRAVEDEAARRRAAELTVHVASAVALYLLNRKRDRLAQIEARFGVAVLFEPDDALNGAGHRIERTRAADPNRPLADAPPAALRMDYAPEPEVEEEETEDAAAEAEEDEEAAPASRGAAAARNGEAESEDGKAGDGGKRRRRRRRRRGGPRAEGAVGEGQGAEGDDEDEEEGASAAGEAEGRGAEDGAAPLAANGAEEAAVAEEGAPSDEAAGFAEEGGAAGDGGPRRRRRRSRGGRGPRAEAAGGEAPVTPEAPTAVPIIAAPPPVPRYVGPTPADPFAGQVDDIYAAMEAAEAALEAAAAAARSAPPRAAPPVAEPVAAVPPAAEPPVTEPVAVVPDGAPAAPPPEAVTPEPVAAEPAPAMPEPVLAAEAPPAPVEAPAEVAPPPAPAAEAPAAAAVETPPPVAAPVEASAPAAAEPAPAPLAEEPVQGVAIQPKVIGEAPIEAPRRSGWWRR